MLTSHALADGDTLVVGLLTVNRRRDHFLMPYLTVVAWDPERRDFTHTAWPNPPFPLDAVVEANRDVIAIGHPPCRRFVGLDPSRLAENRRTLDDFKAKRRRWESEQAFRASRAIDRQHLRRWDVVASPEYRGDSILPHNPPPDFRRLSLKGGLG